MTTKIEPVGLVEIADRLGVSRSAVDLWRFRDKDAAKHPDRERMPEPRWTVGGRPAWNWSDIERWARKTGRLT